MASVHRRPNSAYWHAAFRGTDGRLVLRSTKHTNKALALAAALDFERAVKLAKRGELVEAQAREVLKGIMARHDTSGETLRTNAIGEWFAEWMAGKDARKSARTAERYQQIVDRFLESLGAKVNKPITSLTSGDVDRFLNSRLRDGLAPRTCVLDVKILRTCLNAARRKGLVTVNVAEAVELPDIVGTERGTFTGAEVQMLVNGARGEWKTLILFAYFTGARLSDCCRMQWEGVNLAEGKLTYTQAKTGAKTTAPIHPDLLAHLESLATSDTAEIFVLPHMADLKPGGRHGLSETFKKLMRKCGIDCQTVAGAGVRRVSRRSFHALRHSFVSALANAGVSAELRMKLTGHKSAAVHEHYTHRDHEVLRAAIGKLPGLGILSPATH